VRDGVTVAVNGGRDPRRAQALRDGIAAGMASGDLPLRRRRKPSPDGGRVTLIGAGPGDPDLLTIRGRRLLRQADVVVTDHLVPAAALAGLDADVEIRYAGKRPGHHSLRQEEINDFIVGRALEGHRVVRLKGGDPFLLGRGGEEALACLAAGVPVEVVPGVTSALSVPAAAGIPVTHRGITSSVLVLSGHDGPAGIAEQAAAAPADATLVLLMGTRTLSAVAAALIADGRCPQTPAAVIERGWTPQQRTLVATLGDIAEVAAGAEAKSPAIVVVGDVVSLRNYLGDLATSSTDAGHTLPRHTRDTAAAPEPALVP
jgi:uroporphyrin-III C-methyltransferase/precorrin-2 dehydrogenase/sirohydrochlorin ferrochelatase